MPDRDIDLIFARLRYGEVFNPGAKKFFHISMQFEQPLDNYRPFGLRPPVIELVVAFSTHTPLLSVQMTV